MVFIYKVTCLLDGKPYVGQTQRAIEQRFKEHSRSKKSLLGRAIQKHGKENFKVEVLEVCATREEANEREIFWIAHCDCMVPNGYNLTPGGWGHSGYHDTEETRAKKSARMKKRYENPAERAKQSEAQKKRWTPEEREKKAEEMRAFYREHPEAKAQKSAEQKRRWSNPEEHAKQSAAGKKRHAEHPITDETRQKKAAAMRRFYGDPANREMASLAQKKRYEDPREHEKQSEIAKKFYEEHPESRQARSAALKKYYEENPVSDETRKKQSDSAKARRRREAEARRS